MDRGNIERTMTALDIFCTDCMLMKTITSSTKIMLEVSADYFQVSAGLLTMSAKKMAMQNVLFMTAAPCKED